jgi:hypothetical protein
MLLRIKHQMAVMLLLMVMPPVAVSVKLTVAPVETPVPVKAVELISTTLPAVLNVTFGVAIFNVPMSPLPLVNVADVVPVIIPAPVIEPEPLAVTVTLVVAVRFPVSTILPLLPEAVVKLTALPDMAPLAL